MCEARSTKRSTDTAFRLARRQLSSYQRPILIASAHNEHNAFGGPVKLPPHKADLTEVSHGTSYDSSTLDGMVYQQQDLPALPKTTAFIPSTPKSTTMSLEVGTCSLNSTLSSLNSTPGLLTFYGSLSPQYSDIHFNPSAEDFLYSSGFEDVQTSYVGGSDVESIRYNDYPLLEYQQSSVSFLNYASFATAQNTPLYAPSRSSSLNSTRSSTF
jgi:hypothetical protein